VKMNRSKTSSQGDFWSAAARNWKLITGAGIGGAILFLLFSYTRPIVFEATSTVLPAEHQGVGGMLAMLASSSALDLLKGETGSSPTLELFKTIVESRSIAEDVAQDSVIRTYLHRRDTSFKGMTELLQGSIASEALRTGMLTVNVKMATPRFPSQQQLDSARRMSAYVANKFVAALDRFNRDRLMTTARNTRIFVEHEYQGKLVDLDSAYGRLQHFQEEHQAIALPEQLTATVTAAAKLTSQIEQLEMQLRVEERELNPNSSRMQALQTELDAAKQELEKYDNGGAGEYVLALKNAPALSRELAGYLREVKVLEQVCGYLRQELEQERISEQRDLPSLQVLDPAQPPIVRSSPNRSLYSILGLLIGLLGGFGLILAQRFYSDVQARPDAHYRLVNVLRSVRRGAKAELILPMNPQTTDGSPVSKANITA